MESVKSRLLSMFVVVSFFLAVGISYAEPYFSLTEKEDWEAALYSTQKGARSIRPMTSSQWDGYMSQLRDPENEHEGEPYVQTEFSQAELRLIGPGQGNEVFDPGAWGILMMWGPPEEPPPGAVASMASAWMLDYGLDPDLSNSTISVTVHAPQFDLNGNQINIVSFAMQDINGLIRSWHWNVGPVPAPIQWNVPTVITINTALVGVGATTPAASGYTNNPGFDITQVQFFIVDENGTWVGGPTPVPPPGVTEPRLWNYWYDLVVTPNPTGGPIIAGINIDIHQDIDDREQWPNDFHIEGRIESGLPLSEPGGGGWGNPPVLVQHIDDIFDIFNVSIIPDTTDSGENWYIIKADWRTSDGSPIPFCTVLHLGLEFQATCHNVIIDLVGWWTKNGQKVQAGQNGGYVPIPGFRVEDNILSSPGSPAISSMINEPAQVLRLQNGNGNGDPEPGEIHTEIVALQLVAFTAERLREALGENPFGQLRLGGMQENLPWINVMNDNGPISDTNPQDFPADSFFDVILNQGSMVPGGLQPLQNGTGELWPEEPVQLAPGDFLVVREQQMFTNNSGQQEFRWVWEIHEAHEGEADLGDAPDSSNTVGMPMTAYGWGVPAGYPTVYVAGSPPYGPIHRAPNAVAHLGRAVTREVEADMGFDQDPTNNIVPLLNRPDRDFADDGVIGIPLSLISCTPTQFRYLVKVIIPNVDLYTNVWFDYNRDGDWDDSFTCPDGTVADEWAIHDQLLNLPAGLWPVTTPVFTPWNPAKQRPIWMRITLSEQRWTGSGSGLVGSGGSGPLGGYEIGETEDYIFKPHPAPCPMDVDGDGWGSPIDVSALVSRLLPFAGSYYWVQCP